jgi:outer membrane murein-binding lipoprotein Lpp
MSFSAKKAISLAIGSLTLVAGCAAPGPIAARRTTVGSLKASVAQLEHERDVLKNEVAELKTENRRVTEQVAQQEETNGELHTRLDNARNLLRKQGLDSTEFASPADSDSDRPTTTRTRGRSRRTPAAQIPSPNSYQDLDDEAPLEDDGASRSSASFENWNTQSHVSPSQRWLPIANGVTASPKSAVK